MISAGAVRANGARERRIHLPCRLHAPGNSVKSLLGISTDSKSTDLQTRWDDFRQPCGHACKRTKQEGDRGSGHARGRVRQRRAAQVGERIVSSHWPAGQRGKGKWPWTQRDANNRSDGVRGQAVWLCVSQRQASRSL